MLAILLLSTIAGANAMTASWYGAYHHGHRTASGEPFNMYANTCAHKTLPLGTWLHLRYRAQEAYCRINDRGPYIRGRDLDVSMAVARQLGMLERGVAPIEVEQIPRSIID